VFLQISSIPANLKNQLTPGTKKQGSADLPARGSSNRRQSSDPCFSIHPNFSPSGGLFASQVPRVNALISVFAAFLELWTNFFPDPSPSFESLTSDHGPRAFGSQRRASSNHSSEFRTQSASERLEIFRNVHDGSHVLADASGLYPTQMRHCKKRNPCRKRTFSGNATELRPKNARLRGHVSLEPEKTRLQGFRQ
jgi:hypothetical protein